MLRRRDFAAVADELLGWQVHRRAGLRIDAQTPPAAPGVEVVMRLGLRIPCQVVYLLDGPDERGFAYGTLPGHPERGEEAFVLRRAEDGTITFEITAFSRPANVVVRLGGPLGARVQDYVTGRYLHAADVQLR